MKQKIPVSAAGKIEALRRQMLDADALFAENEKLRIELASKLHDLGTQARNLEMGKAPGWRERLDETVLASEPLQAELDKIETDQLRLRTRVKNDAGVLNKLMKWNAHVELEPVELDFEIKGDPVTVLGNVRRQIENVRAQIKELDRAGVPVSELRSQLPGIVEKLAQGGAPNLAIVDGRTVVVENYAPNQMMAAFCWWLPEQAITALEARLADKFDGKNAIPTAEREAKRATLSEELKSLRYHEEFLVSAILEGDPTSDVERDIQRLDCMTVLMVRPKSRATAKAA